MHKCVANFIRILNDYQNSWNFARIFLTQFPRLLLNHFNSRVLEAELSVRVTRSRSQMPANFVQYFIGRQIKCVSAGIYGR